MNFAHKLLAYSPQAIKEAFSHLICMLSHITDSELIFHKFYAWFQSHNELVQMNFIPLVMNWSDSFQLTD